MIDNMKENSQREELKDRIIETALEAFTTHGIKSVTMDDIAASLGISKRTLYEVFQDKESLLTECILKHHEEIKVFLSEILANSKNVLEVILACYQRSIESFHRTNKRFYEDIKKYPKVHNLLKKHRERDSDSKIKFFKMGIRQGIFRDDVNFAIVNLLLHEQLDLLMNTDVCNKYSFLEVYEAIMFTYIRGISTEKGARVLDDFIVEYRKQRRH